MWVGAYLLAAMTYPPYSLKTTDSRGTVRVSGRYVNGHTSGVGGASTSGVRGRAFVLTLERLRQLLERFWGQHLP